MDDFVQNLANAVKKARTEQGLTQQQVADMADCNVRTVLKIENCRGNPKIETVLSLIHTLKIDPREILSPEMERQSPAIWQLRYTVADCSEQEAVALIPVIESVLKANLQIGVKDVRADFSKKYTRRKKGIRKQTGRSGIFETG